MSIFRTRHCTMTPEGGAGRLVWLMLHQLSLRSPSSSAIIDTLISVSDLVFRSRLILPCLNVQFTACFPLPGSRHRCVCTRSLVPGCAQHSAGRGPTRPPLSGSRTVVQPTALAIGSRARVCCRRKSQSRLLSWSMQCDARGPTLERDECCRCQCPSVTTITGNITG